MRRLKLLLCLCALLLAAAAAVSAQEEADLLARINALRASAGRAPYVLNGALSAAAYNQAQWIVETGSVSHTRPDGSGPRSRALAAGYPSTMVSENIYGGTNATVDVAWNFWINSGVHYAGLVNPSYNEVGIGVARGAWGAAFVLVFGNSGGPAPVSISGGNSAGSSASSGPPAYFVGVDEHGYILHEVQPGDTLGDIALIYGYTWDDLPMLMALNNITDVRDLDIGSIFKVPPYAGTYTPTPVDGGIGISPTSPAPTPVPSSATPMPASITPYVALMPVQVATLIVTPLSELSRQAPTETVTPADAALAQPTGRVVTAAAPPEALALLPTMSSTINVSPSPSPDPSRTRAPATQAAIVMIDTANTPPSRDSQPTWLLIAVGVQVLVLAGAGLEFARRSRKARGSKRS